jgi:hypothetical protein
MYLWTNGNEVDRIYGLLSARDEIDHIYMYYQHIPENKYSQACIKRPPLKKRKRGLT